MISAALFATSALGLFYGFDLQSLGSMDWLFLTVVSIAGAGAGVARTVFGGPK